MKNIVFITFLILFKFTFSQAGQPDTTFNYTRTNAFKNGESTDGFINKIVQLPGGKLLIGGYFTSYNGEHTTSLVKLNSDGSRDISFNVSIIGDGNSNSNVTDIIPLQNGNILVSGFFRNVNNTPISGIVMLDSTGMIVSNFNVEGVNSTTSSSWIANLHLQENGKILLYGSFNEFNSNPCNRLIRLNTNGTLDSTFNSNITNAFIYKCISQIDGKIILAGNFDGNSSPNSFKLFRLLETGEIDTTFVENDLGNNAFIFDIKTQTTGKLIVAGKFSNYMGVTTGGIIRLNEDGTIDNSFTLNTSNFTKNIKKIELLSDDSFYAVGDFNNFSNQAQQCIVKLSADGLLDPYLNIDYDFNPEVNNVSAIVNDIVVLPNGNLICVGLFNLYKGVAVKNMISLFPNGDLNVEFLPYTGSNGFVNCIKTDALNRIIVGGEFTMYNNVRTGALFRLNENGTLDTTFQIGIGPNGYIKSIQIQYDGKIVVAGNFSNFNGINRNGIVRLLENGSIDLNYNPGDIFLTNNNVPIVNSIVLQGDGKIIAGGNFGYALLNGYPAFNLIRFETDGSRDYSFNSSDNSFDDIKHIELCSDNQIIVLKSNHLYRYLPNGEEDYLYNLYNDVIAFSIDNNDNIIMNNDQFLLSITIDGSLIDYYPSPSSAHSFLFQPDGKLIVGTEIGLTRFNTDNTIDATFEPSILTTSLLFQKVTCLAGQQHGQILYGGSFKLYNNVIANNIGRLLNDVPFLSTINLTFQNVQDVSCTQSGQATAFGYSGTPPYSYEWNTTPISFDSIAFFDQQGYYSCTVTDSYGDTKTSTVYIGGVDQNGIDFIVNGIEQEFRPGFESDYIIDGFNNGCIASNGNIQLTYDNSLIQFVNSFPYPDSQTANSLTWNFTAQNADSNHLVKTIKFQTLTTAQIGDSVNISIKINTNNDLDTTNNKVVYNIPVVNGYDPNDKSVYPIGKCEEHYINQNQNLIYRIRFQNTGNSEAINVRIEDEISSFLDIESLRILSSSHSFWTEKSQNKLIFHFDNINLPDSSSDEENSHGYVLFELKPIQEFSLPHETNISNTAEIYFDYNPAVITNTIQNTIFNLIDINLDEYECNNDDDLGFSNNSVFPNPFSNLLQLAIVEASQNTDIQVLNYLGSTVYSYSINEPILITINTNSWSNGVYFIRIKNGDKTSLLKAVKTN
ncbi:MAG: T9SS type A sorting domain-containing protein [Fluviicola sp.]|nr:T9SS type A sorting domain-containing protein [Fluviicola sp.]